MRRYVMIGMICAGLAGTISDSRAAQYYFGFYGGAARTEDDSVTATFFDSQDLSGNFIPDTATGQAGYGDSPSLGARFGIWWDNVPWIGYGQDVSYFKARDAIADVDLFAVTPMFMLRLPLGRSTAFPRGRLYPYAGVGPSFFLAHTEVDLRPALSRTVSGIDANVGLQAAAGIVFRLDRGTAIFGEYRYTAYGIEVDKEVCSLLTTNSCRVNETFGLDLRSHHFLFGVSWYF